MIFVGFISMCNMEEETVDGRGGPMYFYENFDYLLIYTQMITLSVVLANTLDTFNWANILIPLFILACLKSLKVFIITLNWLCIWCEIQKICRTDALKKKELMNLLNFADSMPYPFVLVWYILGTIHLNWIYDNDVKVNYYAQYNDSTAKLMVWLMFISILFKWFILFTVERCYGKYNVVAAQR